MKSMTDSTEQVFPAYRPMVWVAGAVCCGVVADRYLTIPWFCSVLVSAVAATTSLVVIRRERIVATVFLLVSCAAAAALWHQFDWSWFPSDHLALRLDRDSRPVCLRAELTSSPRQLPLHEDPLCSFPARVVSKARVRIVQLREGADWKPASGQASLWVDGHLLDCHCGDLVQLYVRASSAVDLASENQQPAEYGRSRRELIRLRATSPAAVCLVARAVRHGPAVWIQRLRERLEFTLKRRLGPRYAPLVAAMLIGTRDMIAQDQRDAFFLTGTVHLLAISGLHVGILAGVFWVIMRLGWLPRLPGLLFLIGLVCFYCWLAGGRPSVQRATALICVICLAELFYRPLLPVNSLAAAAIVIVIVDPSSPFQAGTQLSFVAVLALVHFPSSWRRRRPGPDDPLESLVDRAGDTTMRRIRRMVFAAVGVSAFVWSATAPLVAYHFHLVSPIGIVLSFLLGFPLVMVLVGGLLTAALSPLGAVAAIPAAACRGGLSMITSLTAWAREIPSAYFWTPAPPAWLILVFYLVLLGGWLVPAGRWAVPRRVGIAVLVVCGILFSGRLLRQLPEGQMRVTFIAVGHGTSVLMELPDNQVWLYDAGHMGPPVTAGRAIADVLWSRGIRSIDRAFLSHADLDHVNAIPYLLDRFEVKRIHAPGKLHHSVTASERALLLSIRQAGLSIEPLCQGDKVSVGGEVVVGLLHPVRGRNYRSDNAASLVMELRMGSQCLLLPGDLESDGLEQLLGLPARRVDVLMAPHHGSRHSDPERVAFWCQPEWVVVSSGHAEASGESFYRTVGSRVLGTHPDGNITLEMTTSSCRLWSSRSRSRAGQGR